MKKKSAFSEKIKECTCEEWPIESQSQESVSQTAQNLWAVTYQFGLKVPELLTDPAQKNDGLKYLNGLIDISKAEGHLDMFLIPWGRFDFDETKPPETDAIREISHYFQMTKSLTASLRSVIYAALDRRPVNLEKRNDSMLGFSSVAAIGSMPTGYPLTAFMPKAEAYAVLCVLWGATIGWFGARYIKREREKSLREHPRAPEPTDYFGQLCSYLSILSKTGELPKPPACLFVSPRCPQRGPKVSG